MIISHKYKFIYFCPVGNCATSSVEAALEPYHDDVKQYKGGNNITFADLHYEYKNQYYIDRMMIKHIPPREFFNESNQKLKKYFKFAVVRNPWDWVLATFNKNLTYVSRGDLKSPKPFEVDLNHAMTIYNNSARGWAVEATSFAKKHFASQYDAHCDDFECLIDKFLHFENLEIEFADLLKDLGLPDLKLPHKQNNNNEAQKKYQNWYGEKEKQIIYDNFKTDIDFFKYEF